LFRSETKKKKRLPKKRNIDARAYFLNNCPLIFLKICESTLLKKLTIFLSPAGMSVTKLSLARNNLIIPGQGEFG
jgi:hypothetical protein